MMKKLALLCCSAALFVSDAKSLGGMYGFAFASVQSDGQVFAWGYDGYGQLGVGGTLLDVRSLPTRMFNVTSASDVSMGGTHTCIVDQSKAKCAGRGDLLGRSSSSKNSNMMVAVDGLEVADNLVRQVYSSREHSCLLTKKNAFVWCWGNNGFGSLANRETPAYAKAGKAVGFGAIGNALDMALGYTYTCVLTSNGEVGCAGVDPFTTPGEEAWYLVKVAGLADVVSISASSCIRCVVKRNGQVFCWGYDLYMQFGQYEESITIPTPTQVPGIVGAAHVWTVEKQTYVILKESGKVIGFGLNDGTLVYGDRDKLTVPKLLYGGQTGVREIRGGPIGTCMLLSNGQVKCIGNDAYGQLGRGEIEDNRKDLDLVIGLPFVSSPSPTRWPTRAPTRLPTTIYPSQYPTRYPTMRPTTFPTKFPTRYPTKNLR